MKKILLTAMTVVSTISLFGQNTFPSSGNVGIGTGSPTEKLQISDGDLKILGFNSSRYLRFSEQNFQGTFINYDGVDNVLKIGTHASNDSDISNDYNAISILRENGNVGIGTTNPRVPLEVNGTALIKSDQTDLDVWFGTPLGDNGIIFNLNNQENLNRFNLANTKSTEKSANYFRLVYQDDEVSKNGLYIRKGGNVGVGTTNPDSELTVKGKIHCEEVQVDLQVPADYVFEKYYTGSSELKETYTMPTLAEVEAYTKENHHLPSIPSATEIQEDGLYLKEMTNLLLQKIEELTLYTIEQEKRIKALEAQLTSGE